uniref:Uncharacterized protein n=1 Tax=Panagrolaimus superbus TaxID=310955 RepID=A0A914YRY1_9BILA
MQSQLNDPWKIRLLSNYIRSFERNRPKKWFQEEQTNNFTCKDSYGRYIPMPLGVQRCFIQHHSIIDQQNNITFNQTQESGTFATPIFNVISEYSCADSFSWKPYSPPSTTSSSMASKILNDQECAVKVSLTTMHFFCCCYLNGNLCGEVGRLTGQGLTCPQLSMDATLTFDERTWEYTETENVEERISAENLVLQHQCHMRISLRRPKRDPIIHTSLSLVKNDDDICGLMFTKQFLINHECVHFERQCYTDVDDELIYCCRFEDSKERSGSEDKILSIHSIYAKYVSDGFEEHLTPYKRCLRPFSRNNNLTQYCVYFYDKIMNRFVNIQIDENYRISNSVNQKIQNFLNDDSQDLIYIEGELNKKDKRVTQCDEAESLSNLPFWYRPTVAMFKCFTNVNDTERCDDFVQNGTIIEEVKKRVEDQVRV